MKKTNKSVKKRIFKKILRLILSIAFIEGIAILMMFLLKGFVFTDEAIIMKDYEDKKQKCELMESVRDNVIKENDGIYLENMPSDDIIYKIYNCSTNNNIIFNYYIPHYENQYNTTITLSKEYKILDEKSITKLEDYESYKKSQEETTMLQFIIMLIIGAIFPTVYFISDLLIERMK